MIQGPGQLGACLPLWTELGDSAHLQQSQEPELVTGPLAQPLQGSTVQHELGTARRFRSGLPLFHSLRPVIAEGKGAVGVPAWRARRADSMCPEASLADRFLCSATMVPTRPSASNRSRLGRAPFIPEPTSATVMSAAESWLADSSHHPRGRSRSERWSCDATGANRATLPACGERPLHHDGAGRQTASWDGSSAGLEPPLEGAGVNAMLACPITELHPGTPPHVSIRSCGHVV